MSEDKGVLARRHDDLSADGDARSGAVLSHSCLLVLRDDWTIATVSENSSNALGRQPRELLGRTLEEVFTEDVAQGLSARAQVLSPADPVAPLEGCPVRGTDRTVDATVTRVGAYHCFEFETPPHGPGFSADPELIRRLARRVAETGTLTDAAQEAARVVGAVAGFARVSIHRTGRTGFGSALGLAGCHDLSDAPGRTVLRAHAEAFGPHVHLIPDLADIETSPLVTGDGVGVLSRAELRALGAGWPGDELAHALYREGVRAALTIPIRVAGELWGAILCHHDTAMRPSVGDRGALALFAHFVGYEIGRLERDLSDRARARMTEIRDIMARSVDERPDLTAAIRDARHEFSDFLPHDGWLLWRQGKAASGGHTIAEEELEPLFAALHRRADRDTAVLDHLSELVPTARGMDARHTAVMVIPLSREATEFLLLFRRVGAEDDRLRSWESWEVEAGKALRSALIEIRMHLSEAAGEARMRRQERQGLLMAELNHRMRNLLNLIQGLVAQGAGDAGSVEEYAEELAARIFAVARAHDDLSQNDWGRVGLRLLLERELGDVLNAGGPSAHVTGAPVDLSPAAFATMALVLHELARNAREHGALSRRTGRVDIDMVLGEDGFARLEWRETGGPDVRPPERRGLGLKVIEDSVPHELRGTAELDFAPGGLVARFALPPGHFTRLRPETERDPAALPETRNAPDEISIDGAALILDDSLIIAIESEDILRAAGASEVYSCNSVEAAFAALDKGDVTFAILDVNLGNETSLPVAEQLWIDGIPAVLATGYGANEDLLTDFPPLPVLGKPYTIAEIKEVLRHFSERDRG